MRASLSTFIPVRFPEPIPAIAEAVSLSFIYRLKE